MKNVKQSLIMSTALAAALWAPVAASQDAQKVAIVAELSGGGASSGTMYRDGVLLGIKDINANGGILGSQIEVVSVGDTQSDPATSVAVMRRAINDDPFAVFGTVYSSSTVVNQEITAKAGIPQISGSESAQVVAQGNDNVFLTSFSQAIGFKKLVKYVAVDLDADKIALVYVNDSFGQGGYDAFVEFLAEYGKELALAIPTEVQQADFTAELLELQNAGITHVVVYSHEEENGRFMIQLRKMGLDIETIGDNLCSSATVTAGGAAIDGSKCHLSMSALSPLESMRNVAAEFEEEYGHRTDHNGFKGYIGAHLLKAAVERVGEWDRDKVITCLHDNLFTVEDDPGLLTDTYVFANGDADRASYIVEVVDGEHKMNEVVGFVGGPYTKRDC
jgi:branched-chain amino acid transport system substrate-binding protein